MRLRIFVIVAALVGFAGAGTLLARGGGKCGLEKVCCAEDHSCCQDARSPCCETPTIARTRQWSIANFVDTVMVNRTLVSGQVLIVHDDEKMARGEPCTTFYRFEPGVGPKEALVSFHCKPRRADKASNTTLTTSTSELGIKRLVEYQIGGESEAHGVPR